MDCELIRKRANDQTNNLANAELLTVTCHSPRYSYIQISPQSVKVSSVKWKMQPASESSIYWQWLWMKLYVSSWTYTSSAEAASDGDEASDGVLSGGHGWTLPEEGLLKFMTSCWLPGLVDLRREDPLAFKKFLCMPLNSSMKSWRGSEEESGGSTRGTGSRWNVSSWQLLSVILCLAPSTPTCSMGGGCLKTPYL